MGRAERAGESPPTDVGAATGIGAGTALVRAVLAGGREALLTLDADGAILTASDGVATLLGWQAAELRGRPLDALIARPDGTTGVVDVERRDGSTVRCTLTAWVLADAGAGARIATTLRAADAGPETVQALAEDARVARALLELGATLHSHLDEPYILDWVITSALRLLGCDLSCVLGWDAHRRVFRAFATAGALTADAQDALAALEMPARAVARLPLDLPGDVLGDEAESGVIDAGLAGRLGVTSAFCTPITRRGEIQGVLLHGYRERRPALEARERRLALGIAQATAIALDNALLIADLQLASRVKSEFVGTMSHELRTPLNVIAGYTEMLADGADGPLTDAQATTVARVRQSTLELLDLVNATLDLPHLESPREAPVMEPVDLAELFGDLDRELQARRPGEVALDWRCQITHPVLTDRRMLRTIVRNLTGNALKFTSAGRVSVTAADPGGRIVLAVEDTGIGIPPEHLSDIFEPFRQVDGSNTRRFGGAGLGLYVVKRLAQALRAQVTVESTPQRGSTFTVTLPAPHAPRPIAGAA